MNFRSSWSLQREEGRWFWPPVALLALVSYVPLLLTRPGRVSGDTLDGLYLDPTRTFLDGANRWDPGVSFGAVVDRTFGASFPMSPYYWFAHLIHLPTWIAQRLWMGTLLFAAGLGVVALLRRMHWEGPSWIIAPIAYISSPYVLTQMGVQSVTLLSFAALPWLIALTMAALDEPTHRWREPARIGIVVALTMGGSFSAFLGIVPGPMLWIFYVVVATREVPWRRAAAVVGRCMVTSTAAVAWWLVGLATRPRAEIGFARTRDPFGRVASASIPSETIRSLGDWRFYVRAGRTALDAGMAYQRSGLVIGLTFIPVAVALVSLGRHRFHNRIYIVMLFAMGVVLSSAMSPRDSPEAYGRLLQGITKTSIGAFLLPTARCAPLTALAVAIAFTAGMGYVADVVADRAVVVVTGGCLVAMASVPALYTGHALDGPLLLADEVPSYWREAAADLDSGEPAAVLEVPGLRQPDYIWGTTRQPVSTSLIDRTVALRTPDWPSQPATADLLAAIDDAGRSDDLRPEAVAPLARLLGVDSILLRFDGVDDTGTDSPAEQWRAALGAAVGHGITKGNDYGFSEDEGDVVPEGTDETVPQLTTYRVDDPLPLVRLIDPADGFVISGNGAGIVGVANQGLLSGNEAIQYSGAMDTDAIDRVSEKVPVVVTDSARFTVVSGEPDDPVADLSDPTFPSARIVRSDEATVIPNPAPGSYSLPVYAGGLLLEADSFNSRGVVRPEDRPANVFDGDPETLWVGPISDDPAENSLVVSLPETQEGADPAPSIVATAIRVQLPVVDSNAPAQFATVTQLDISAGKMKVRVPLGEAASRPGGQEILLPERVETSQLQITPVTFSGTATQREAGFAIAEIRVVGDDRLDPELRDGPFERIALPTDIERFGDGLAKHPMAYLFERWQTTAGSGREPEQSIHRRFVVTSERTFDVTLRLKADQAVSSKCRAPVTITGSERRVVKLKFENPVLGDVVAHSTENPVLSPGVYDLDAEMAEGCAGDIESVLLNDFNRPVGVQEGPSQNGGNPLQTIDQTSASSYQLRLSVLNASWLTIGASYDSDWKAAGLPGLGAPTLLNGAIAGWYLPSPTDLPGDSTTAEVVFTARWAPQRLVSVAVIFSAVAFLVLLVVAVAPTFRGAPTEFIASPETLRAGNSNLVVLTVLGVFGVAAGAIPAIVAGCAALLLESKPHFHRRVAWTSPLLLAIVATFKVVHAVNGKHPDGLGALAGPQWIEVLTYTAVALAVTAALANTERPPVRRYPIDM